MPSDNLLRNLLRREPMATDEWARLLDEARDRIKPFFDQITLPTLGQLACLPDETGRLHDMYQDHLLKGRPDCDPQGIFRALDISTAKTHANSGASSPLRVGLLRGWGLLRSGEWVTLDIRFGYGFHPLRAETYCLAKDAIIHPVDARDLLNSLPVPPREILRHLSSVVDRWTENKRTQLKHLINLDEELASFVKLSSLIPAGS